MRGVPRQGHGQSRLTDACGEQRLTSVVQFSRLATVAQTAEQVNAGSDTKESEHNASRFALYGAAQTGQGVHADLCSLPATSTMAALLATRCLDHAHLLRHRGMHDQVVIRVQTTSYTGRF